MNLGRYNKLFGALVGAAVPAAALVFGITEGEAQTYVQAVITLLGPGLGTYVAARNAR